MTPDAVDLIVEQWSTEREDLDASALHILSRLFRISGKFQKDAAKLLKEFELEYWEFDVLAALLRHGKPYTLSAAVLSNVCLSSFGAMTHRIDRLISRELVLRQSDSGDRRKVLVTLTRKGKSIADKAVTARLKRADSSLSILTTAEKTSLEKILRKLM